LALIFRAGHRNTEETLLGGAGSMRLPKWAEYQFWREPVQPRATNVRQVFDAQMIGEAYAQSQASAANAEALCSPPVVATVV
jgi:hypothetical protein